MAGTAFPADAMGQGDVVSTIRGAWPLLSQEEASRAAEHLDVLASVISERYGHPREVASAAARATLGHVATPGRSANAGWVQVFASGADEPLGRGQLLLFDVEPGTEESASEGEIANLHLNGDTPSSGRYLVRFEANGEVRETALVWCDERRGPAAAFLQPGLPITILELSDGE